MWWGKDDVVVVKKASDIMEGAGDTFAFFTNLKHEGLWFAVTGEHFWPWLREACYTLLSYSDALVLVAVILGVAYMAGSQRSGKWLWWTFLIYMVSKGLMLHLA